VEVGYDEQVCFVETVKKGDRFRGSFQVVRGGLLDIDMAVFQVSNGKRIKFMDKQEEGAFDMIVDFDGLCRVCFGNKFASSGIKHIQFSLHLGEVDDLVEQEVSNLVKVDHVDRLNKMVLRLATKVSDLKEQEEYLVRRTNRHHETSESTLWRVLLSSISEASVLVGMNLGQIHYLKQFFSVTSII